MKELDKYLVFPTKYIPYLSDDERSNLLDIVKMVQDIRINARKNPDPVYIVCKETEPYADVVWNIILEAHDMDRKMSTAHDIIDEEVMKDEVKAYQFDNL